jgi:hypothetical protein
MGILPMRLCGIGILPMIHGLEAHATTCPYGHALNRTRPHLRKKARSGAMNMPNHTTTFPFNKLLDDPGVRRENAVTQITVF